jgi:hypothetical protein
MIQMSYNKLVPMKKFLLYLLRWQLSTPILWLAVREMGASITSTIAANLIGGCIFFWVDRFIFTSKAVEMWHIKDGKCDTCGKWSNLWRLVLAPNYDKRKEKPKFMCMACSEKKTAKLRKAGIKIRGKSK